MHNGADSHGVATLCCEAILSLAYGPRCIIQDSSAVASQGAETGAGEGDKWIRSALSITSPRPTDPDLPSYLAGQSSSGVLHSGQIHQGMSSGVPRPSYVTMFRADRDIRNCTRNSFWKTFAGSKELCAQGGADASPWSPSQCQRATSAVPRATESLLLKGHFIICPVAFLTNNCSNLCREREGAACARGW
jgi:hypothetical protein